MPSSRANVFDTYWQRIKLRERAMALPAPCVYWQRRESFNDVERLIWTRTHLARRILDYGSGDQSLRRKFTAAGFTGQYDTFDVSPEFDTTWRRASDITGPYDAVFCLEVLEHMPLEDGLELRDRLARFVDPGGTLVISTPNPSCVLSPFSRDETHLHTYPLHDLLTWAMNAGFEPEAWRVKLVPDRLTARHHVKLFLQRVLCYAIGADRADGLLMVAKRTAF